jgi:hypothetical protein
VLHTGNVSPSLRERIVRFPREARRFNRAERMEVQRLFGGGKIDVLITMNLYTMGVDFPKVETLFMARPTLSPVLYSQMLGRGMRGPAFGGTKHVTIVDFVDQDKTHGELRDILMNYNRQERWSENIVEQLDWATAAGKRRLKRERLLRATKDRLRGVAGLYRLMASRRNGLAPIAGQRGTWRYVQDIGGCVRECGSSYHIEWLPARKLGAPRAVKRKDKPQWCQDALRLHALLLDAGVS